MNSAEAWSAWFEENFPTKISADARQKYSALLIDNEVLDLETFSECIDLEPDFLSVKINVKNASIQNLIKRFVQAQFGGSGNVSPVPLQPNSIATNSPVEFEPVTNVGSDIIPAFWKIDNVVKLPFTSLNRSVYSGTFTVANVTREVFIKRQCVDRFGGNDLEHEAAVYKAIRMNACLIELLYFQPQAPNSYLVLERFGRSLNAFLHNKCAIRLQIMEELGLALSALHSAGFVHCDIKPQNILVDSREGTVRLKLCDLDSAERIGEFFQHVEGALKYTEQWVSPEVYFGRGGELRASPAIDLFSYGLIAAVLFDDAISENKTILPRKNDNVAGFEQCLTSQEVLNQLMPCQRGKRYEGLVHRMCSLNPANRATLKDVDLALGLSRATAIHAHNAALSRDNEFLKHEVVEKQAEVIQHLHDIKQSLAELGSKLTLLLQNDVELKNMLNTVVNGSFDCPTLFIYVPVAANQSFWSRVTDPLSFVQDRFKLYFMCTQTMEIVPCGPEGDGYAVSCNKAWLVKAAPYIKVGLILLKEVMATYHLPLPIASTLNILASDCHLHSKYIDGALNYITASCRAEVLGKAASSLESVAACLDATDRVVEMKSVDRSPSAAKEAYASIKSVLTTHNYWSNVSSSCGLVSVTHKGYQAWIKADKKVESQFVEQCEEQVRAQAHLPLPPAVSIPVGAELAQVVPAKRVNSSPPTASTAKTSAPQIQMNAENSQQSNTNVEKKGEEEAVNEDGIDAKDIALVVDQAHCTRAQAVTALRNNNNDMVDAIMEAADTAYSTKISNRVASTSVELDEEVHELFLQCRLSDSEAQTARLTELSNQGSWLAEPLFYWLCGESAPFIPKDEVRRDEYLAKGPSDTLLEMAKNDNKYAQFALSTFYTQKGPHYNASEGVRLCHLAAEQGHPVAQRAMGVFYFHGYHDLTEDEEEGVRWFRLAAEQGFAAAQWSLARCYGGGSGGLAENPEEAVRLYSLAAEQGFASGQFSLAKAHAKGNGGLSKSDTRAVEYYELAAAQGHASSMYELGLSYYNNNKGIQKKNLSEEERIDEMIRWYRKAADLGHVKSMCRLGGYNWDRNHKKSFKWYHKACVKGSAEGQFHTAQCYDNGRGVTKDATAALEWYSAAAKQEYVAAYFFMGHFYQHGLGGAEVDFVEATKWYQLTCNDQNLNGGTSPAAQRIKDMAKQTSSASGKKSLFGFGLVKF